MKGRRSVTSGEVLAVFLANLQKDESMDEQLLVSLKAYYRERTQRNLPEEDIKPLFDQIKQDEYFKSVAQCLTKYFEEKDERFWQTARQSKQKKAMELAKHFLRLTDYESENDDFEEALNISVKKNSSQKPDVQKIHEKKIKDLTPVYRWSNIRQFKGRKQKLIELTRTLETGDIVVITGIRGIGKTSLVKFYITTYDFIYDHIAWITISEQNIRVSLMRTFTYSDHVDFSIDNNDYKTASTDDYHNLLKKLSEIRGLNLMIIDNAGSSVEIQQSIADFKKLNVKWKLIFTSYHDVSTPEPLELNELSPDESLELFMSYYSEDKVSRSEKKQAIDFLSRGETKIRELLKVINYHPLLIELIAKVDIEDQFLDLEQISGIINSLEALRRREMKRPVVAGIDDPACAHLQPEEKTPYNYIKALFEKDLLKLSGKEQTLLCYFSFLPSVPVPVDDLLVLSEFRKDDLLEALHHLKGWLRYEHDVNGCKMADLYRFAVREILSPGSSIFNELKKRAFIHLKQLKEKGLESSKMNSFNMYINELSIIEQQN